MANIMALVIMLLLVQCLLEVSLVLGGKITFSAAPVHSSMAINELVILIGMHKSKLEACHQL